MAGTFDHNVSVIVLNYNHAETTLECLEALRRAESPLVREIIVVDNGSDDEEVAILRQHKRTNDFVLVEVGENRYFSEGNNIGVDFATGDFIVFLNNDAFVEPGWIEELAATMANDPTVAAVGPMFLYPDGRVQEVGSLALPTGDVVQVGKGSVWGPEHYDTPCVVDFCSAACLLMRRSDFLNVGGFGFEWEPAYYEDVDLCLKLWTTAGKVMVNPRARVVHIESKTTSSSRLRLDDISEINRDRFARKWGPWLEARQTAHLATLASNETTLGVPPGAAPVPPREELRVRPVLPLPTRPGRRRAGHVRAGLALQFVGGLVRGHLLHAVALQLHPPARSFRPRSGSRSQWPRPSPGTRSTGVGVVFLSCSGIRSFRRRPPSAGAASINCSSRSGCPTSLSPSTPNCSPTTTRSGCTPTSCGDAPTHC